MITIINEYYAWLTSIVEPPPGHVNRYSFLMAVLFKREFFWLDIYDSEESRANDGRLLRDQYMIEFDATPDEVPQGPVTVLEMLVSFAMRIDSVIYDWSIGHCVWQIFEMFIQNLGLGELTDSEIRENDLGYINAHLDNWMAHDIGHKGERGLFRFRRPLLTISNLDNWSQAQEWIKQQM